MTLDADKQLQIIDFVRVLCISERNTAIFYFIMDLIEM